MLNLLLNFEVGDIPSFLCVSFTVQMLKEREGTYHFRKEFSHFSLLLKVECLRTCWFKAQFPGGSQGEIWNCPSLCRGQGETEGKKRPFQISRRLPWGSSDFYRGGLSSSEMSRFPHLCTGILRIYIEALSSDTYTVQMISVTLSLSRLYPWSSN